MVYYGSLRKAPVPLRQKKSWKELSVLVLKILALLSLLSSLIVLFISIYVGWNLTHPIKKEVDDSPSNYNLLYKDIEVESRVDQTLLSGWEIETLGEPKGVIIFSHGYGKNRLQEELPALALAARLVEAEYHVLLFDYRNSGQSEGSLTSIGYFEQEDLLSLVEYAKHTYPDLPIGVVGFSMGAATAIIAAEQDSSIQAVVADSSFANLREYLQDNLSHWSNLPNFPFTPAILTVVPMLTGIDVDQVSPRDAVSHMNTPQLLIHGDADIAIPYQQSEQIAEFGQGKNVSLWLVPGAGHVGAYAAYPDEYTQRVIQFFGETLD